MRGTARGRHDFGDDVLHLYRANRRAGTSEIRLQPRYAFAGPVRAADDLLDRRIGFVDVRGLAFAALQRHARRGSRLPHVERRVLLQSGRLDGFEARHRRSLHPFFVRRCLDAGRFAGRVFEDAPLDTCGKVGAAG